MGVGVNESDEYRKVDAQTAFKDPSRYFVISAITGRVSMTASLAEAEEAARKESVLVKRVVEQTKHSLG